MAITNSTVSKHERIISLINSTSPPELAFIAEEGTGLIEDGTFQTTAYEVVDMMPNMQWRFCIYNADGKLMPNIDSNYSHAGKPGKCLWCHEINLQILFQAGSDIKNYLTQKQFISIMDSLNTSVKSFRKSNNSEIDFTHTNDHTYSELLYITFMEPTLSRIALEWKMSEKEVAAKLQNLPTHTNSEYLWMGQLYDRNDIESLSSYNTIRTSHSVREPDLYEPDFVGESLVK